MTRENGRTEWWNRWKKRLLEGGKPEPVHPTSANDMATLFYNSTIQPYQQKLADQWKAQLGDYFNEGERAQRTKMNQRQEELIKLILADVAEKAGGELIYPLARLEAMENMHIMIEDNSDQGFVKIHLLPPEVMAGIEAGKREAAEEAKRRDMERLEQLEKEAVAKQASRADLERIREQIKDSGATIKQLEESLSKYTLYDPLGVSTTNTNIRFDTTNATTSNSSWPPGYVDTFTKTIDYSAQGTALANSLLKKPATSRPDPGRRRKA